MWSFLIGAICFIVGGNVGIFIMCLMIAAGKADDHADELQRRTND